MRASWGPNERVIDAKVDLDEIADAVRRSGSPTMVFLEADDGSTLVFGLGHDESVLTFVEPDGTSFHSLGDKERKGFLLFLCRDQVDEFMMEMAVPERDALVAAEEFVVTSQRPSAVAWEADW